LRRPIPIALATLLAACGDATTDPDPPRVWSCTAPSDAEPHLAELGCAADFASVASVPLDATIPGARSVKTVLDRTDGRLYFQDSVTFPIHWDFASAELSGDGLPIVPMLAEFNLTEYSSPSRRFLLGAVTHYEGPDIYVYEIAPYDSASSAMVLEAFNQIAQSTFFGASLRFLPTSESVAATARGAGDALPVISSDELFEGIDYQPLNVAETYGRLVFSRAAELNAGLVSFRDVVVLDEVPNDISVVSGIITDKFQTPLSHINVLSRNRGTPNMGLRGAFDAPALRALEGQWVRLRVASTEYELVGVDRAEADAWWDANKPTPLGVPGLDDTVRVLTDIEALVDLNAGTIKDEVKEATRAFGGKAAHYSALTKIDGVPIPKAFAVPVWFYKKFMADHGFDTRVQAMLQDATFTADPVVRDQQLASLRDDMEMASIDADLMTAIVTKLRAEYPGIRMRFRSSTNAEDLDGFTGAGLYTSKSGDPDDPDRLVEDAIRKVWASVWFFRAFEERSYRGIDHLAVGMALLVHRSFPEEEANGVALTNNPFDPTGLEPAFYVNVQLGDFSVVRPAPGITTDAFLYYFDRPDQPITYISRSNLTGAGVAVLTRAQVFVLGQALDRIRTFFAPAYGVAGSWWAMDVEFKFDGEPGEEPELFVKQARPYQ